MAFTLACNGSIGDGTKTAASSRHHRKLTQFTISPENSALAPHGTDHFTVSEAWSDGSTSVPMVTYAATGGTIAAGGLYTAGATSGTFRVIATQQGGTIADTAAVTVIIPAPLLPALTSSTSNTLRSLAAARGFAMGAAVGISALHNDARYRTTLATQYNSVVPENAMKFKVIHPEPTQYSFADADEIVIFAQTNGMAIHGHALAWHEALPSWVTGDSFTKAQLLAVLKDHITSVVGRYAGKVASWDVVNEPISWNGRSAYQNSIWRSTIGPAFIDSAFVWTHRADPTAKLYVNDYDQEIYPQKADSLLALVLRLRSRGVPIDGVGFQTHLAENPPTASVFQKLFARFTNAGFDVRVSEMDERISDNAGAAALSAQGGTYRDVLDACLLLPRCTGFTTWGVTDLYSWIPKSYPGFGRGLPFDANYRAKPASDSLAARLRRP